MQDGLFFRILRRVNSIVFALLWIALLVFGGLFVWKHGNPFKAACDDGGHYVPLAAPAPSPYIVMPGAYDPAAYRPGAEPSLFIYGPMSASASISLAGGGYGSSSYENEAHNLMVIDDKGEGHWLFKNNDRLIQQRYAVRRGALTESIAPGGSDPRPAIGLVMSVIDRDANGDGLYDEKDPLAVYLWKAGETSAVKLMDVSYVATAEQVGADRYRIVYGTATEQRVAVYSVPEFEKLSDKPLPDAPH